MTGTFPGRASRRRLLAPGLVLLAFVLSACGTLPAESEAPAPEPSPGEQGLLVASTLGCRIDDDCAAGTFCFQRACVRECASDAACADGAVCSGRSRCVVADAAPPDAAPPDAATVDETGIGAGATRIAAIEVTEWPAATVEVGPGEPFVQVKVRTATPVPGGVLLYSVRGGGADGTQVLRAIGSRDFTIAIPTGEAGGDAPAVTSVQLSLPMGSRTIYLVPALPVAGHYSGTFTPPVFGGAGLPLDLVVETVPGDAPSLGDAQAAWLWVPTSVEQLLSLAQDEESAGFVRRPLVLDESVGAWVASFSNDLASSSYFGPGVFPSAQRSLRIEIFEAADGQLRGALADRWYGLFERRNADGLADAGVAAVAGYFELQRIGALPAGETLRDGPGAAGPVGAAPLPSMTACEPSFFAIPPAEEAEPGPCAGMADAAEFAAAPAEHRAACAIAVADRALGGPTIGSMLQALLDPDQPNPGGMSFASFIAACASESDPLCTPTPQLLCARDLVAHAYRDADASGATIARLAALYDTATREAFVGRQLAAFHVDTQSRLQWLQGSEAPPFLASTLLDYNQQILRTWQASVLDAHLEGVFGQLDAAGLAVLARATTDPNALASRRALLLEVANSWRAAMDALVILTERWNILHQGDVQRAASAAEIRRSAYRLYASAAILQELSRNVGSSYLVSEFGAGFSGLMRELSRLSLPFDALVYARDAEVVVARSLDPREDSRSLLGEVEASARKAVAGAAASVDLALDEAQNDAIDEVWLTARYEDQLLSLRNEIILLCGLPVGCGPSDVGSDDACGIPTRVGRCGFVVEPGGAETIFPIGGAADGSISDGGDALLSLQAALFGVQEAEARLEAHARVSTLTGATVEAFADRVADWDRQRRAVSSEIDVLLNEATALNDARIDRALETLQRQQAVRDRAYEAQRTAVQGWHRIRVDGVESDMRTLGAVTGLNASASALRYAADRSDLMGEILKDGSPKIVGLATDPSFVARMSVRYAAFAGSTISGTMALGMKDIAAGLELQLHEKQALRNADLTKLQDLAALGVMATDGLLAGIETELATLGLENERKISTLEALKEALLRYHALDLAHERDLMELRDRRDAWRLELVGAMQLSYESAQAVLTVRQRENAYFAVVQRAQLLEGRFRNMQIRWQSLEGLLGSPDVLFSSANRMARAESRIDAARRALEEWLVALEYYAVRPFVSQRLAILLARNPAQLEAIANEFSRLQLVCGGPSTLETVDVSLRDDLLRMSYVSADEEGRSTSAAVRFRALLARAESTLQSRVIYTAKEPVLERLERGGMWAVSFDVDTEGFANLGRTCNARIDSIAVQLLGEELGRGPPVVSIVHHGASQLRSCQPGIADYVASLGADATAFGPVTGFRTAGRMVSPIAGIGSFGDDLAWSSTLEGIPFASGYTILIDREHPSNEGIDWDRLEDIRIQFRFTYQDVFPEGQCE